MARWSPARISVAVLFGLCFALDLWEAVGNALQLPSFYATIGLKSSEVPWWLLVVTIAAPVLVYAAAIFVARRRSIRELALVLLAALALEAALNLSLVALEGVLRPLA